MVRIARTTIRIIIIFIQLSLTLVSIMGTFSSLMITSSPQNIQVDTPNVTLVNGTMTTSVDITLVNVGLYDFTNFAIKIEAEFSNTSIQSDAIPIIIGETPEDTILAGETYNETLIFVNSPTDLSPLTSVEPIISYWDVNIIVHITSEYSLEIISFDILLNISVEVI